MTTFQPMGTEVEGGPARADALRATLVEQLREEGSIRGDQVAAAFARVPRHLFAPEGVALEKVYAAGDAVVTKRDEHGMSISSISAPQVQATMLEQSGLGPGMRALEIGSGGYNAALMAELVGPAGEVTTVDIDADVIDRARVCLKEAGYGNVNVVLGDGEEGCGSHAPYDAVIVTVGAWDIPPAWVDQLADGGILTVPLRMRGLTRSVGFTREGDHLLSRSVAVCGFVKMQGAGAHAERLLLLRGKEIGLRFDDDWPADAEALNGAFDTPRAEAWSGVTVGGTEPWDTLQMWLATALDGFCLIAVDPELDTGLVAPVNRMACPAVVEAGSFAYLALRKNGDGLAEFGAHAFGPDAAALVERLARQVHIWDRDHRGGPGPSIAAYPAGTLQAQLPVGRVVAKRHVRVIISWPLPGQGAMHHPIEKE